MLKEKIVFAKEFFRSFQTTGSFCATGRRAAETLAEPIRAVRAPRHILEIGPGTGSVTRVLLQEMSGSDTLTVCEINPRFMAALKERLAENADYQRHKERVRFFLGAVQDMPEDNVYNAVVCAVPFNNFDRATTEAIFAKVQRLTNGQAQMSYYEYIGLRHVCKISPCAARRKRIREVAYYLRSEWMPNLLSRKRVWLNVLPIYVYTLALPASRMHAAAAAAGA